MRIFFLRSNSFLLRQLEIYSIFTIIEMSLRKGKKTKTDLNNLNKSHKTVTIYITTIFVISWKLVCNIFIYLYTVYDRHCYIDMLVISCLKDSCCFVKDLEMELKCCSIHRKYHYRGARITGKPSLNLICMFTTLKHVMYTWKTKTVFSHSDGISGNWEELHIIKIIE